MSQQTLLDEANAHQPLAERLRPLRLADVVGQQHLLAPGKPIHSAMASGRPHSLILWGPPGVGKTTLAKLMASEFNYHFIALSAVLAGVKDIRAALDEATHMRAQGRPTLLFVDEIHRFNKTQQDGLLSAVEEGLVVFIGATTENPSFEVNSALLSRAQVYVLHTLTNDELNALVDRAQAQFTDLEFAQSARAILIGLADGDARRLLNLIEQIANIAQVKQIKLIESEFAQAALGPQTRRFDKGGDQFYDQISALHKSVRGSDPDAALYWLVRMLDGGADARYLARRIVRMAWEDIGLADPRAIQLANDAATTYERLGSPEGDLALAQTVIYLAVAAKSNAGYSAFNSAKAFVSGDSSRSVPMHLRNAPTMLMKSLGAGSGYRYAHDEDQGYAAGESYLPEGMPKPNWYQPTDRGLEAKINEKMAYLRQLDSQSSKGSAKNE
jgi:putative ATPase